MLMVVILVLGSTSCASPPPKKLAAASNDAGSPSEDIPKPDYTLDQWTAIQGTRFLNAPLYEGVVPEQEYSTLGSYSAHGTLNVLVNYAFVTRDVSEPVHWLLPHHNFLIRRRKAIFPPQAEGDKTSAVLEAFIYYVVENDTNGDERLNDSDEMTIAISTLGGQNYTRLFEHVTRVMNVEWREPGKLFVAYETKQGAAVAWVSTRDFTILAQQSVPSLL